MDNNAEFPDNNGGWVQVPGDAAHHHNLMPNIDEDDIDEDAELNELMDELSDTDDVPHVSTSSTSASSSPSWEDAENEGEPEGFDEPMGPEAWGEIETLRNNLEQSKQREEDLLRINKKAVEYLDNERKHFWANACAAMCANYAPELAMAAADELLEGYDKRFTNKPEPGKEGERKLDL